MYGLRCVGFIGLSLSPSCFISLSPCRSICLFPYLYIAFSFVFSLSLSRSISLVLSIYRLLYVRFPLLSFFSPLSFSHSRSLSRLIVFYLLSLSPSRPFSLYVYMCIHTYIYIYINRGRERYIHIYIYIYLRICVVGFLSLPLVWHVLRYRYISFSISSCISLSNYSN